MKTIILLFIVSISSAFASIIPANDLYIGTQTKNLKLSEAEFNTMLDKIEKAYGNIVKEGYNAKKLVINRKWDDGTVNASAGRSGRFFVMNVYGGLARYKGLSNDGFMLVLCHEMGHLIGGAPTWKPRNVASSEGQADYFSTTKCFRKIIADDDNESFLAKREINEHARAKCSQIYKNKADLNICLRSSIAQESLAGTLADLGGLDIKPEITTPDPKEVGLILFNGYPSAQCRLDTLFAGSLCNRPFDELAKMDSYNIGMCTTSNGFEEGLRPKCWYAEREDNE